MDSVNIVSLKFNARGRAAFDTVDHTSLKACLIQDLGTEGAALQWVESYITDRQQTVTIREVRS